MTAQQTEIDFTAINTRTREVVKLVGNDHLADEDYKAFLAAVRASVRPNSSISQNDVRLRLLEETVKGPRCSIDPNRYSALWSRACAQKLIEKAKRYDGRTLKDICTTSPTGNNGKEQVVYAWIGGAL